MLGRVFVDVNGPEPGGPDGMKTGAETYHSSKELSGINNLKLVLAVRHA